MSRRAAVNSLVRSTYLQHWSAFYDWEKDHARTTLASLHTTTPSHTLPPIDLSAQIDELEEDEDAEIDASFTVTFYNSDGEDEESQLIPVDTVTANSWVGCPPYEICTPTNRNIFVGDDSEYMPFMPLADDPSFDALLHSGDYKYLGWQKSESPRDPDLGVITTSTVHALLATRAITLQEIEDSGIFNFSVLVSEPNNLILYSKRRDYPPWMPPLLPSVFPLPGNNMPTLAELIMSRRPMSQAGHTLLPYLPRHSSNISTPSFKVSSLVEDFCTNLNCLTGYCSVHLIEHPQPLPVQPTLRSTDLSLPLTAPCSTTCFLLGPGSFSSNFSIQTYSHWTTEDRELLALVLRHSPDTAPCDLSVIVKKPCRDVWKYRQQLIPDSTIPLKAPEKPAPSRRSTALQFIDHDADSFTPQPPCSHPGPCSASTNCSCFLNKAHCESGCRCDRKCIRRWPGCRCAQLRQYSSTTTTTTTKPTVKKTCRTNQCPCYKAHRECDPEVCVSCKSRDVKADLCRNSAIQRGARKMTEVRTSTWGLGLFTMEPVQEDDFIVEYTGELIYQLTTLCRDFVSQHRQRTYLFQVDPTMSIDSNVAGNEARFINHDKEPNCYAGVRLVNGEHRIGIFAVTSIPANSELFLNYGEQFFRPQPHTIGGETATTLSKALSMQASPSAKKPSQDRPIPSAAASTSPSRVLFPELDLEAGESLTKANLRASGKKGRGKAGVTSGRGGLGKPGPSRLMREESFQSFGLDGVVYELDQHSSDETYRE